MEERLWKLNSSNWSRVGEVLKALLGSETWSAFTGIEDKKQKDCEHLEHASKTIDRTEGRQAA